MRQREPIDSVSPDVASPKLAHAVSCHPSSLVLTDNVQWWRKQF